MRSSSLLFVLLPLALAASISSKCECPLVKCPGTEPALCNCLNSNAIRCAKLCGHKPVIKKCPIPASTSTPTPTPTQTSCGSRGLPPCATGQICIVNPATPDCDPRADCPGICVSDALCGGIAAFPCPNDQICVDNPNDDCDPANGGADCGGVCAPNPKPSGAPCGGFLGTPCEGAGEVCVDDPSDDCDPQHGGADCSGICIRQNGSSPVLSIRAGPTFASCAGFTGKPCANPDLTCVDDPRDSCDPKHGGADCAGICVGKACGGFAGLKCKAGQTCVDDPRDSCDPKHGGADCIGVCI